MSNVVPGTIVATKTDPCGKELLCVPKGSRIITGTVVSSEAVKAKNEDDELKAKPTNCSFSYALVGFYMCISFAIIIAAVFVPDISQVGRATIAFLGALMFLGALLQLWFTFQSYVLYGKCGI